MGRPAQGGGGHSREVQYPQGREARQGPRQGRGAGVGDAVLTVARRRRGGGWRVGREGGEWAERRIGESKGDKERGEGGIEWKAEKGKKGGKKEVSCSFGGRVRWGGGGVCVLCVWGCRLLSRREMGRHAASEINGC